jgi:flagellar L-ring protein precursor FlgH
MQALTRAKRLTGCLGLGLALAGCQANDNLFTGPTLTPVGVGLTMERAPVPSSFTAAGPTSFASLFGPRSRDLLVDNRAMDIGDTLTIDIRFDDLANFTNETNREGSDFAGNGGAAEASAGLGITGGTEFDGEGQIDRRERLRLRLAAVVTDRLPNGNLFISGTQEIKVTNEVRVLNIAGIVDPLDISRDNTVPYTKIAEARITYAGRGRTNDVQRPPWGQLVYDTVAPF